MLMRRLAAALAIAVLCAVAAGCSTGPMSTPSAAQTAPQGEGAAPVESERTVQPIQLRLGG